MHHDSVVVWHMLGLDPDRPGVTLGRRAGSRIRLLHGPGSAQRSQPAADRRQTVRLMPEQTRWSDGARLRPGLDVRVLDIGPRGVLLELQARLHVGGRVELSLVDSETQARLDLAGTVRRCHVACLDPLVFHGAVEFDDSLDLSTLRPFVTPHAQSA